MLEWLLQLWGRVQTDFRCTKKHSNGGSVRNKKNEWGWMVVQNDMGSVTLYHEHGIWSQPKIKRCHFYTFPEFEDPVVEWVLRTNVLCFGIQTHKSIPSTGLPRLYFTVSPVHETTRPTNAALCVVLTQGKCLCEYSLRQAPLIQKPWRPLALKVYLGKQNQKVLL